MPDDVKKYDPITLYDHEIRALRGEPAYMNREERDAFIAKCDLLQYRFPFEVSEKGVIELTKRLAGDVPGQLPLPFEGKA